MKAGPRLEDPLGHWLNEHRDDLIEYLRELVRIPADNPPGDCAAIATRVEEEFRRFGLGVERHDVAREAGPPAPTVLGWLGAPTKTPAIMLNAHVDVVPPGDGWTVDPYGGLLVDGRVVGRGAAVSKSDVAAYTYALASLRETSATSEQVTVVAAITADEETGGALGPGWLVSEYGLRPRRAICAGFTHGVVITLNGCLQGRILIEGKAAHAAMPWKGDDPIRLAQAVLARLYELDLGFETRTSDIAGIKRPTVVATTISGGGPLGVTADSVEIGIDRRILPSESVDDALAEIQALVRDVAAENGGASVEFEVSVLANPLVPSAAQDELVRALCVEAPAFVGHELEVHGLPIYTDARWFSGVGVPTVLYGAGGRDPVEGRVHAADENVTIADLVAATEVIARAVCRLVTY
jgi:acetylornithine deacetylase/succinyl-diaminopimelate desuccinylase-like protein